MCGNVGQVYTSTTVAFASDELSSVGPPVFDSLTVRPGFWDTFSGTTTYYTASTDTIYKPGPPSRINYQDVAQNCSTIAGYTYYPGDPFQGSVLSKLLVLMKMKTVKLIKIQLMILATLQLFCLHASRVSIQLGHLA